MFVGAAISALGGLAGLGIARHHRLVAAREPVPAPVECRSA